jgi:hypothetical protein
VVFRTPPEVVSGFWGGGGGGGGGVRWHVEMTSVQGVVMEYNHSGPPPSR